MDLLPIVKAVLDGIEVIGYAVGTPQRLGRCVRAEEPGCPQVVSKTPTRRCGCSREDGEAGTIARSDGVGHKHQPRINDWHISGFGPLEKEHRVEVSIGHDKS